MTVPRFAVIKIDHEKCKNPFDCKKCLQACGQSVFAVSAINVVKGRENNPKEPGKYILRAGHRDKCTGCNDCIEVCDVDAITITFPPVET